MRRASKTRMKGYDDVKITEGDLVFYQYEDKNAWLGPEKVFTVNRGDVFIFANGVIRKVPRCKVQLCDRGAEIEKGEEGKNVTKVQFEEQDSEGKNVTKEQVEEQGFGNDIERKDIEEVNKRITRSMTDARRQEMRKEEILTFWMQMENSECFDEMTIYTVEVPVREHKKPEVIEAKQKEIENLEKYGIFNS